MAEKEKQCEPCGSCAKGNTALVLSLIFAGLSIFLWITKGQLNLSAISATILFIGITTLQKYRYIQKMKNGRICDVNLETKDD